MGNCLTYDTIGCLDIPYEEKIKRSYKCIRTDWMTKGMSFNIPPYRIELIDFDPNFPDNITYYVYKNNTKIRETYAFLFKANSYDNYNICIDYRGYKASPQSAEFLIHYVQQKSNVLLYLGIAGLAVIGISYLTTRKR